MTESRTQDFFAKHDKYGNDRRRSLFETALAKAIIENESKLIFSKINKAIIRCIQENPLLSKHMMHDSFAIRWDLIEDELIDAKCSNETALESFIELLKKEPLDIPDCLSLHRIFFERHFSPELISQPVSYPIPKTSFLKLGFFCQSILQKSMNTEQNKMYDDLLSYLMPDSQFSEKNRGRREIGIEKKSHDFGILEEKDMPSWAKNWHKRNIYPAKEVYRQDPSSSIVESYKKNNIPFIAGPSGTTAYCLLGVLFLLPITNAQLKEYVNLLAAGMIALGHHSFYDVMQTANNLKIFHLIKNTSVNHSRKKNISLLSGIELQHLYDACLTDHFKSTKVYQELTCEYPEFIGKNNLGNTHAFS